MKILILMETEVFSGPAKNLLETLKLLRGKIHFEAATFLRGHAESSEFIDAVRAAGFPVHILREKFRYDPSAIAQLARILREVSPDVVQIHNTKSRLYVSLLRRRLRKRNVKEVHFFHGETWVDRKQHFYNRLDRFLFRAAPNIAVVADFQKRLLAGWGVPEDRIAVVYNGIQTEAVSAPGHERGFLLTVGRLSREKGHRILLEGVHLLRQRGVKDFCLHIVGDGPERTRLEEEAVEKQLGGMVAFEGYRSTPSAFYNRAGLFVLPSLTEGFPNVLLEAAAHGVPVISFDVGGIPEIFQNGEQAVLLVDHTAPALADSIQDYLLNPEKYEQMAEKARLRVMREFSLEKKADRLLGCYQEILAPLREKSVIRNQTITMKDMKFHEDGHSH